MEVIIHSQTGSPKWHPRYREAFSMGFAKHDIPVGWTDKDEVGYNQLDSLHVLFGPNYYSRTFNCRSTPRLCVDRCSVGNANDFVTLSLNGWGGEGEYPIPTTQQTDDRFEKWGKLFPPLVNLPAKGNHITILGEYPSASDSHADINLFYTWAKDQHDGPVYFRPHPFHNRGLDGTMTSTDKVILHTSQAIYTYKTSFGVHCKLLGLPVVASSASLAGQHPQASFEDWRKWLLFTQWHIDELRSGEFWEYLRQCLKQ